LQQRSFQQGEIQHQLKKARTAFQELEAFLNKKND